MEIRRSRHWGMTLLTLQMAASAALENGETLIAYPDGSTQIVKAVLTNEQERTHEQQPTEPTDNEQGEE